MKHLLYAIPLVLVVGARLYQLVFHPEWTEAQALRAAWPIYLGAIIALLPLLVVRKEEEE